jgi:hypothetical protein
MVRRLLVIPFLVLALSAAAEPAALAFFEHHFNEPDGLAIRDSGPLKVDGLFSTLPETALEGAGFVAGPADQWQPMLGNGAQLRHIKERSERLLLDTEAPVVFDRNADYAIDYAGGRVKPLAGGRMRDGQRVSAGLVCSNAGPERVPGREGRALRFNGFDAYVDCGEPDLPASVDRLTIDLWFQLPPDWNRDGLLFSKGETIALGFEQGVPVFRHAGLKTAAGKAADATRAPAPMAADGAWHRLTAAYSGDRASLALDGREVARTETLAPGPLGFTGLMRLGGVVEPRFYKGLLDDLRVSFRAAQP